MMLKRSMANDAMMARMRGEIELHAKLQGLGIVRMLDSFADEHGVPYMVRQHSSACMSRTPGCHHIGTCEDGW